MTAKSSATDHDFEELRHDIEVFTCHATDASAMPAPATAAVRPTIDF
jgi:hypothetical protein